MGVISDGRYSRWALFQMGVIKGFLTVSYWHISATQKKNKVPGRGKCTNYVLNRTGHFSGDRLLRLFSAWLRFQFAEQSPSDSHIIIMVVGHCGPVRTQCSHSLHTVYTRLPWQCSNSLHTVYTRLPYLTISQTSLLRRRIRAHGYQWYPSDLCCRTPAVSVGF